MDSTLPLNYSWGSYYLKCVGNEDEYILSNSDKLLGVFLILFTALLMFTFGLNVVSFPTMQQIDGPISVAELQRSGYLRLTVDEEQGYDMLECW